MESSAGSAGEAAPLPSLAFGVSALSGCAKLSQGGAQVGHCVKQDTSGAAFQHKFGLFLDLFIFIYIYILKDDFKRRLLRCYTLCFHTFNYVIIKKKCM